MEAEDLRNQYNKEKENSPFKNSNLVSYEEWLERKIISLSEVAPKQEQEEKDNSICNCVWPSCQYKSNCRNNRKAP